MSNSELYNFDCKLVHQIFYSEDSSFGIAKISTKTNLPNSQKEDLFLDDSEEYQTTIVGVMPKLEYGTVYHIEDSKMKKHDKFGVQYSFSNISSDKPTSIKQQSHFLQSIINKNQADSLLEQYPNIVEQIMEDKVDNIDLKKVKGVGVATFEKIKKKVIDNYVIQDLLIMLLPLGVSRKAIDKMMDGFGKNALQIKKMIDENPYILTRIHGLGFKKVDIIALKINPDLLNSEFRTIAFLNYYFKNLANTSGDTYTTKRILSREINSNIPQCKDIFVELYNKEKIESTFLYMENDFVGLKFYKKLEDNIVATLDEIDSCDSIFEIMTDEEVLSSIKETEEDQGFEFDEDQRKSIFESNKHNVIIITAPAGGGKSSVLRGIVNLFKNARLKESFIEDLFLRADLDTINEYSSQYGGGWQDILKDDLRRDIKISQCALSARAAKRIKETTKLNSATIHRTLGANGKGFAYNKSTKMPHYVNVIDEMSMVNLEILNSYFQAIKNGSKLILVFDFAQLPPIGSGDMSRDLLELGKLFICKYTKVYRQGKSSGILIDANKIRVGNSPFDDEVVPQKAIHGEMKDMIYLFSNNLESIKEVSIKRYLSAIKQEGIENVMLITPKKKSGILCANVFNTEIQDVLLGDEKQFVLQKKDNLDTKFKLGSKVIFRKNDYKKSCFNGDEGYIVNIDNDSKKFVVEFIEESINRNVEFSFKSIKYFDLGYCVSVHFAQGSQAPTVIGVLDNSSYIMLNRKILYTAISRSANRCLLISQPKAFNDCIADINNKPRKTWTDLVVQNKLKGEIK